MFSRLAFSEDIVKFSDASKACVCIPIRVAAYKTRLNPPKTSTKEGVKFSDSLIAIYTTTETPTAASESEEKLLRCHTRCCIDFPIAAQSVYGDFRAAI